MTVCGGLFIRCIGMVRAETAICLKNMAYNVSRFAYLAVKKPKRANIVRPNGAQITKIGGNSKEYPCDRREITVLFCVFSRK